MINFFEILSKNIGDILNDYDNECNVIIEVGEEPNSRAFKAHSIILKYRCSYFKDLLSTMTNNDYDIKLIKRADISITIFEFILKYIYEGTISLEEVESPIILDLLITSNEFHLEELTKYLQQILITDKFPWLLSNFSQIYQTCSKNLQQFCVEIITKYPNIIFDSDDFILLSVDILISILNLNYLNISEGKIWNYVIKWGISQNLSLNVNPKRWSDDEVLTMKLLDSTLWQDIMMKFMAPNLSIATTILPPRNIQPINTISPPISDPCQIFTSQLTSIATALKKCGKKHLEKNENDKALDLSKSLEIDPTNVDTLCLRGKTFCIMKRHDDALEDLNKSLTILSTNTTALKFRGITYLRMNRFDDAIKDLSKLLEILPNDLHTLYLRGDTYFLMENYDDALEDLNKSLEIDPEYTASLNIRGNIYRMIDRNEDALIDFTKSLEINPVDMFILRNRGLVYHTMKRYKEALIDLTKALEIDPNNGYTLRIRGFTYHRLGEFNEALADLTKSLDIEPNNTAALRSCEDTREDTREDTSTDLIMLKEELKVPNERGILNLKNFSPHHMSKYEIALKDLTKYIEFVPNDTCVLLCRGNIYIKMNKYKEALEDLNRFLEINPNDLSALETRSEIYFKMEMYEKALDDVNEVLRIDPDNAAALEGRGQIYYRMNRFLYHVPVLKEDAKRRSKLSESSQYSKKHLNS
ncbi:hypothetical protein C2G38_2241729 [Gigaspora rosea]|uniref:BTB domain-containing protein n=1 Tax=Gigaspora rosea TaxID=44941 RepID=A0A397W0V7_9GLOM|nr:hypothetical protein C2G38_2241729 [Gigaspora rosea]